MVDRKVDSERRPEATPKGHDMTGVKLALRSSGYGKVGGVEAQGGKEG